MGFLPTIKKGIESMDPKNLILFGLPKVGKTTALAKLPGLLIVDCESGSSYIDGYVAKANSVSDLHKIAKALKEEEHNFKYVAIDTITALEDMCLPYAKKLYQETPQGKNFAGDNILQLPNNGGYLYLRTALFNVLDWFNDLVKNGKIKNIILVGHVKDKNVTEGGTDLNVKTLDLGGKASGILSGKSDAICYLYRDTETGDLMANFGDMNSVLTGARMPHLAGKTIQLAERKQNDNGEWEIVTHWDRIYPSLKEENEK